VRAVRACEHSWAFFSSLLMHFSAEITGKIFWSRRDSTGSNSRSKQFIFVNQPQLIDPGRGRTSASIVHLGRVRENR
jgi:hypothetical protein